MSRPTAPICLDALADPGEEGGGVTLTGFVVPHPKAPEVACNTPKRKLLRALPFTPLNKMFNTTNTNV